MHSLEVALDKVDQHELRSTGTGASLTLKITKPLSCSPPNTSGARSFMFQYG